MSSLPYFPGSMTMYAPIYARGGLYIGENDNVYIDVSNGNFTTNGNLRADELVLSSCTINDEFTFGNTTDPVVRFDSSGNASFNGELDVFSSIRAHNVLQVLSPDNEVTTQFLVNDNCYIMGSKLGIGTRTPTYALHIENDDNNTTNYSGIFTPAISVGVTNPLYEADILGSLNINSGNYYLNGIPYTSYIAQLFESGEIASLWLRQTDVSGNISYNDGTVSIGTTIAPNDQTYSLYVTNNVRGAASIVRFDGPIQAYGDIVLASSAQSQVIGPNITLQSGGIRLENENANLTVAGDIFLKGTKLTIPSVYWNAIENTNSIQYGTNNDAYRVGINNDSPQTELDINGSLQLNGTITCNNTTNASNDGTDAALHVLGGVKVEKDVFISGGLFLSGKFTTQKNLAITNTLNSTTPFNGSFTVAGGIGVNQDIHSAGSIYTSNIQNESSISPNLSIQAGQIVLSGSSVSIVSDTFTFSSSVVAQDAFSIASDLEVGGSIQTTSTLNAGDTVIQGSLRVQDTVTFQNDILAQSDLTVVGNAYLQKPLTINGNLNIQVSSTSNTGNVVLQPSQGINWNQSAGTDTQYIKHTNKGDNTNGLEIVASGDADDFITLSTGTLTFITMNPATFTGQVQGQSFLTTSDIKFKTNIHNITNALDKVNNIRGVTFNKINDNEPLRLHAGVIAQEVEAVFPEVVNTHYDAVSQEEYKTVEYGNMNAILIEAIKELTQQNNELRKRLDTLETKFGHN